MDFDNITNDDNQDLVEERGDSISSTDEVLGQEAVNEEEPKTTLDAIKEALNDEEAVENTEPENIKQNTESGEVKAEETHNEPDDDLKTPDGLGVKANERFQALANEIRERRAKDEEIRQITETYQEFRRMANEGCDSPEEVANLFDYAKSVKNGDFDKVENYLREQVAQFEAFSGRSFGGGLMSNYSDLKQRVDDMELDEQTAREVAAARWQQQQLAQQQQQYNQFQQQQYQQQMELENARQMGAQAVNNFSMEMAKSDLMWPEIEPKLTEYARKHLSDVHPSQWVGALSSYYHGLKASMQPVRQSSQPLRTGISGSGSAMPKTTLEAIRYAIDNG